jgi:hypothetical protein
MRFAKAATARGASLLQMGEIMYVRSFVVFVLSALCLVQLPGLCLGDDKDAAKTAAAPKDGEKVLRHAVFFKFKDGTSQADVDKVLAAFDGLPKKIDTIKGYQRGKNTSSAGFSDGFTHCFFLTFADEDGRATYLPHPDHKAFGNTLRPHLDKVFVVDYWGTPEKSPKERELKHGLFLKFKESATPEQIKDVEESLARLPSECPTIKAFEWGKNNSPEKHDEGFTHCYMFTFDDGKGLKDYASTAAHTAIVAKILAIAEKGRVLDFWTKEKAEGNK